MKKVLMFYIYFVILFSFNINTFAATSTISSDSTWTGSTLTESATWNFKNAANITLKTSIVVPNGVTLTINGNGKVTRATTNITYPIFNVQKGGKLIINGDEVNHFIVDGNNVIAENSAISASGDIYLTNTTVCNNKNRKNNSNGGGLYIEPTGYLELIKCKITKNTACRFGGGFYSAANIKVTDTEISYNRAMTTATEESTGLGRGGGFLLTGKVKGTLTNVDIHHNAAMYYGGAMQIQSNAEIYFDSGNIHDNETIIHGAGAVHLTASAKFTMDEGASIANNKAHYVGGAIHTSYACVLNLNGGEISGNTTIGRGGGVHINVGGELILNGTNITNNKAITGRRVSVSTVDNTGDNWTTPTSSSTDAITEGYGGGVLVDSGTCTMNRGMLSENYASVGGGGIGFVMIAIGDKEDYENKIVSFTMENGEIKNNTTGGNGGGVYLMKNMMEGVSGTPTITLNGGNIENNSASGDGGAAYLEENTEFIINENTRLENNHATGNGGAVYIENGIVTMNSGDILNCNATHGGAIYIASGNFKMYSGMIEGCATEKNGGVVYITNGNFIMESGVLANNQANNLGGALRVENGDVTIGLELCKGKDPSHACPIIKNNSAVIDGGAISMGDGLLNYYCGNLLLNTALNNQNGNAIHQTGGTINIYGGETQNGFFLTGGVLNDYREHIRQINYHAIYDGMNFTILEMVNTGALLKLPNDIFIREGYHTVGWSLDPNNIQGYMEVGEEIYITSNVDFYAVWIEDNSYMIYIPEEVKLNQNGEGEFSIDIETNNFDIYEKVQIIVNKLDKRFYLDWDENVCIDYDIVDAESSLPISEGDLIGTFTKADSETKNYKLKIKEKPKIVGRYIGTITFIIEYINK